MKLSRFTKVMLLIQLLLLGLIFLTPSKDRLQSLGAYILCSRIRDFVWIPLSLGTAVLLLGSVFTMFGTKLVFPGKPRPLWLAACILAVVVGIYVTVGAVLMTTLKPLPTPLWHYLMKHSYVLSLWWVAAGIFFLLTFCRAEGQEETITK